MSLTSWNIHSLKEALESTLKIVPIKQHQVLLICRKIVTNSESGPSILEIMEIMGKQRILNRIHSYLNTS
jgi:glutamyl/glutaminyl-tRNA synthetase